MKMMEAIADRIRHYLKEREITQYQLSNMTAIPQNTLQGIMQATYIGTNSKNLFLIIRALGLTIAEFFDPKIFDLDELVID